jgi:hypothetical protein
VQYIRCKALLLLIARSSYTYTLTLDGTRKRCKYAIKGDGGSCCRLRMQARVAAAARAPAGPPHLKDSPAIIHHQLDRRPAGPVERVATAGAASSRSSEVVGW